MAINSNIIHIKHCRLIFREPQISVTFKGVAYVLAFESDSFRSGKGVVVQGPSGVPVDHNFLLWLSVYFGEDFLNPSQEIDTRYSYNRGAFSVGQRDIQRFMSAASRFPRSSHPKWKEQLIEYALIYFTMALRSGLAYMPVTIGFFGVSLECIGNIVHERPGDYQMLGALRFKELIKRRFARYKRNPKTKAQIKVWQKHIEADIELILLMRNMCYGHLQLHTVKGRMKIVSALRDWYIRAGSTKKHAAWMFKERRLELDLQVNAASLYKVGLRTSRLLIFMILGFSRSIPFSTHDYLPMGDRVPGEVSEFEFNGKKFSITNTG
ncbi:hypothetical protein LGM63_20535 [Burkholderia cepacia]|uniref:hypothetical protein n=1 Tax=Burkholderia cepacia TaxID=292 RepID=UPI001CF0FAD3|nr:hypothetical protein [Burkholderia cepacia]MCA7993039.1 hypothetical protein [Burkholderia cepacia]